MGTKRILVVDDDPEVIQTFRQWLQLEGYEVRVAADGKAALALANNVDAIILDFRMPVLDGLGFLQQLRGRNCRVPVAIVTGDYMIEEGVLRELEELDARIVFKPLWVDELSALTAELLGSSEGA